MSALTVFLFRVYMSQLDKFFPHYGLCSRYWIRLTVQFHLPVLYRLVADILQKYRFDRGRKLKK